MEIARDRIEPGKPSPFDTFMMLVVFFSAFGILVGLFIRPLSLGLGIVLVSIVVGALSVAVIRWYNKSDAFRPLMTSQATILDRQVKKWEDNYGREWRTYWLVFQFDVSEGQVTLKAGVKKSFYESMDPGTIVTVRYAEGNPCIALLEGEDTGQAAAA